MRACASSVIQRLVVHIEINIRAARNGQEDFERQESFLSPSSRCFVSRATRVPVSMCRRAANSRVQQGLLSVIASTVWSMSAISANALLHLGPSSESPDTRLRQERGASI